MEGIPPNDLKEHERQRNGGRAGSPSSGEDEPAPKKTKPEGLLGTAPGALSGSGMTHGMPSHLGMQMNQFHHMMGAMGHMPPYGPG